MAISIRNGNAQIIGASGVIASQSGILDTAVREGVGVYLLTMNDGARIAPGTILRAEAVNVGGVVTITTAVERVSDSQCRVRVNANSGAGGAANDQNFVLTTTGLQVG